MVDEDRRSKGSRPALYRPEPSSPTSRRSLDYYLDPSYTRPPTSPAVLFEWHKQGKKRQELPCARSIRDVLLPQPADAAPRQKLVIVRSCDEDVRRVLESAGGVERKFLDAHGRRRAYRGRVGRVCQGIWWEVPERKGSRYNFRRVSLWLGQAIGIIVLDMVEQKPLRRSNLKHHRRNSLRRSPNDDSSLEDDIWDSLGADIPIQDILADSAWHHWLALTQRMDKVPTAMLSDALHSLEAQLLSSSQHNPSFSQEDILTLITTTHRRLLLAQNDNHNPRRSDKDDNDRGLDRIAYLGGIILPITVVSGVLAIEGPYGPEGSAFWVFWVASGVCCVAAVLVIYMDQVRKVQVWMQVAVDDVLEGGDGRPMGEEEDVDGRIWRRRELGWGGAVKKVSGWYWVKGRGFRYEDPGR